MTWERCSLQRSKAEEEERRRAEEERVRVAQAAAEAATQAAAEEAARQAAEQQRQADEAAVRAQNLAAQKAQAEQARLGPSPEILARIQKELAEVSAAALSRRECCLEGTRNSKWTRDCSCAKFCFKKTRLNSLKQ